MLLEPQDVELFFKLHRALMFFVDQRLKVIPDNIASAGRIRRTVAGSPPQSPGRLECQLDLIESFVEENPAHLSDDDSTSFVPGGISWRAGSTSSVN